jgi:dipeptidyl aminopeptidase/acylaminoacyl peptidase
MNALVLSSVLFLAAGPAEIPPNEHLVLDGVPPLPSSLVDEVGRYTEFRSASFRSWSPARREMLIATRFGETSQIHLVKGPGADRRQLTFFKEKVGAASFPRRRGDYFVFAMDKGGNEFAQLYRYDLPAGTITLLTDGGARSQNRLAVFSRAGDRLAYTSTRRNEIDRDVYLIDPLDPKTDRRLAELPGGGWSALAFSPDDTQLLLREEISANESRLWMLDVADGTKRVLTPKNGSEQVLYDTAVFAKDGRSLFVATDRGSEFVGLGRLDLASGSYSPLTGSIPWDVDNFDLSSDGSTIALTTNEDGVDVLRLLDADTGREKPAPRLPVGVIFGLEWREGAHEFAVTMSTARAPYDVYSVDVDRGTLERWTESETGGLDTASFAEPELVRWKSFDARTLSGFLYKPPARFSGRRPVVIDIHGGPESQERPGFIGRDNYFTNELGVALLYPNVRGSSGYGKSFLKLDDAERRGDSVKDIGALLDWIAARPDLDPARVLVTGGSYGGYMTLAVATQYGDRIRAAVDVVGISNLVTFLQNTEAYRRDLRRVEYGDERDPRMREILERLSPINSASRITRPLFVIQGRNDPRVPWTESQQMVDTVKKNGTPVWFLMADNEGHGFGRKQNQDFQFYATVAFLKQYLLQ